MRIITMFGDTLIPPAFVLFGGAFLLPFLGQSLRPAGFLLFSLASLVVLWLLPDGVLLTASVGSYHLAPVQADQLSRIFGAIFSIITFCGGVYAMHLKDLRQQVSSLVYAGSALGVTFAGDYITLFVFWELMAVSSLFLIWARQTPEADRAGMRYLVMHLFGGSLLLAGILLQVAEGGDLLISHRLPDGHLASWLVLAGVALNAAVVPLHAWLTDSYPKASVTGAVFMSALTTKVAVYVLARLFDGWEVLVFFGVLMTVYGVTYAVLSNDIREILAYHIVSQVGYMVAGVGIGTAMALNGATAHAFSHILYKALLFMGAGVILETTGKSKLSELGGLGRALPVTFILYMVGAFSISGVPLFNGFVSKSMVVSAAEYDHRDVSVLLMHLASIGTFLSVGLKLPYFTWFHRSRNIVPDSPPVNMHIGMGIVAFLCIMFGIAPGLLYEQLPYPVEYEPYTIPHIVESVQLLTFTFVGFWVLRAKLAGQPTITLDTDWFYRKPAPALQLYVVKSTERLFGATDDAARRAVAFLAQWLRNPAAYTREILAGRRPEQHFEDFDPDKQRPRMGFIITIVLGFFIVLLSVALFMY